MSRLLITVGVVLLGCVATAARGQGLAEPVLDSDATLKAKRATLVQQDDGSKLILLEGDVSVSLGLHRFKSREGLVRVTRRAGLGPAVYDLAFYFGKVEAVGESAVHAAGDGLLVTAATRGRFTVTAELTRANELPESPLTRNAVQRFEQYDSRLAKPLKPVPQEAALSAEQIRLREQRRAAIEAERRRVELPEPGEPGEAAVDDELIDRPVLPARGTVTYGSIKKFVWENNLPGRPDERALVLFGGVKVQYHDEQEGRDVLLTAERVVMFIRKGEANPTEPPTRFGTGQLLGVYLEDGAMVSDGTTTVRAPRVFYDLKLDKAILLDAVVFSYDLRQKVPLYMRADVIRQTSADSFQADDAVFTTSEFGKPHLAIGASRVTLQQSRLDNGDTENWVTADGVTLRAGDTPFFYWPTATVEAGAIPLRRIRAGYQSENGADVQTAWDVFALTGTKAPRGVEMLANVDMRGEHGLAVGTELTYEREVIRGALQGYFLPSDSGTDEIARRADVGLDSEARGFFHAQHRQFLPSGWELWLEANHVSDPTLLEEFFSEEAYASREYETSAYFKRAEDDWALTALIKGEVNNFTPQYAPLLTPGYTVNKLPEAQYLTATSVLGNTATLYHESRVGRMRAVFGEDSPGERGFGNAQSLAAFGIAPGTSFDQAAITANFPRDIVTRLDSRTEIAAPFRAGTVDLTPFAVGRVTAYDDDFSAYNGGNNDQARLWGGFGLRASTQLSKTDSDLSSRVLDVQGLRHIVEPGVTVAYYDGTINRTDLPIYDPEVERLTEGAVARLGVVNTWQTQRGGPGRTRTVDWLTLRTDAVLVTEESTNPDSLGRYYDYRPEYTLGDDHFYAELLWAVTEATAMTGELTHNFDQGSVVQWRTGIENTHSDRLTSLINYREIDALDARLLSYGMSLQLTTKYRVGLYQVIDFGEGDSRLLNLAIDRKIPRANLGVVLGYDDIDGEASISIVLSPDTAGLSRSGLFGGQ